MFRAELISRLILFYIFWKPQTHGSAVPAPTADMDAVNVDADAMDAHRPNFQIGGDPPAPEYGPYGSTTVVDRSTVASLQTKDFVNNMDDKVSEIVEGDTIHHFSNRLFCLSVFL